MFKDFLYGTRLEGVMYEYDREAWEKLHDIFSQYYCAVITISQELYRRISQVKYELFEPHGGIAISTTTITFTTSLDGSSSSKPILPKERKSVQIKIHHPDLFLEESNPLAFAMWEYRVRIHEAVHLLRFLYVDQGLPVDEEFVAEALTTFTLGRNGIDVTEYEKTIRGKDSVYRKGRDAAREALGSRKKVDTLRRILGIT